jgi:hypothetical protein
MTSRTSTAAPILAVLAVVLVLMTACYGGAYVVLSDVTDWDTSSRWRFFQSPIQEKLFQPAARFESLITGREVKAVWFPPGDG